MSYAVTRIWSLVLITAGATVLGVGLLVGLAIVVLAPPAAVESLGGAAVRQALGQPSILVGDSLVLRILTGVLVLVGAMVVGAPMLVGGQVIRVVLAQRDMLVRQRLVLVRILRRLSAPGGAAPERPATADERFRWRR
jgi:hypothetical protein